ncbi:MAG: hypothetical protein ABI574_08320 [Burkholderiales bacterium]
MPVYRFIAAACLVALLALFAGCGKPDPQQTFAQAVLNANLLHGFAGRAMQSQLAEPGVKLVDAKTGATAPMSRTEVLQAKVDAIEAAYAKVKALGATGNAGDGQPMVEASRALFELTLPVYRNEYRELAALYDSGAPKERTAALEASITSRYEARFQALQAGLISAAQAYAAEHKIDFRVVNPSPPRR